MILTFGYPPEQVLTAATFGGAQSACMAAQTGTLTAGKKAKLLILDLDTIPFTPLNDIANHFLYCENGSSITHSIINGEIVAEDGNCLLVDEKALMEELRDGMPAFQAAHQKTEHLNHAFETAFWNIHQQANSLDLKFNRLGQEPSWKI